MRTEERVERKGNQPLDLLEFKAGPVENGKCQMSPRERPPVCRGLVRDRFYSIRWESHQLLQQVTYGYVLLWVHQQLVCATKEAAGPSYKTDQGHWQQLVSSPSHMLGSKYGPASEDTTRPSEKATSKKESQLRSFFRKVEKLTGIAISVHLKKDQSPDFCFLAGMLYFQTTRI